MAIVTTIGSASANSYITLSEWQEYWAARNVDLTQHGHDDDHEANLIQAADYINRTYNFHGQRQYEHQAQAWPRLLGMMLIKDWPVDPDTIPQDIKDAQAEMAYLIHQGATPFATVSGGAKVREKSKAGPVETEVEYTNFRETPRYVAIEGLLAPYTTFGGAQVRVMRG